MVIVNLNLTKMKSSLVRKVSELGGALYVKTIHMIIGRRKAVLTGPPRVSADASIGPTWSGV